MSAAAGTSPAQLARLLGLPEPTAEQAAVIGAPLEPLAVIAGAGSGKSETMAARLVWLVANGMVRPERVLGLTFTRKAAASSGSGSGRPGLRGRRRRSGRLRTGGLACDRRLALAAALAGRGGCRRHLAGGGGRPTVGAAGGCRLDGEPIVSTYHSYAARLVADHALREALEPIGAADHPGGGVADGGPGGGRLRRADGRGSLGPAVGHRGRARPRRGAGRAPAHARRRAAGRRLAGGGVPGAARPAARPGPQDPRLPAHPGAVAAAGVRLRRGQGASARSSTTATRWRWPPGSRPGTREVGAIERARYQVVLLDEFQDTSHAQLVLLRALFGGGHPVTAVGDPCQSIYGWRGASAGNLRPVRP